MTRSQDDICFTPATKLATLIRTKSLSPVDVLEAVLDRVHQVDPKIHAFVTIDADRARQTAREAEEAVVRGDPLGPLHGVPVSVKDLFATIGLRTTFGTKFMEYNVPDFDAVAVERLRSAGAVIFGKTNTPAFGHKDMCDNLLMEATRNPWNVDRTSGASSGGAGAAVAAGLGPVALGSDGAGSIRIPAALCGIYGFKPSFGRIPFWPGPDYWSARSHLGPMTRTVRDAALMLSATAGPDPRDPLSIDAPPEDYLAACDGDLKGLRVAWSPDFGYAPVEPEVHRATEAAARRFAEFGCEIVEATATWDDPRPWHATLFRASLAGRLSARVEERPEWIDPTLTEIIELGKKITGVELVQAQAERGRFYDQARQFMEGFDLLLMPAMPLGAWSYERPPREVGGLPVQQTPGGRWPLMFPFNVLGWPAASVPCGFTSEALPIGLQIVAPWHQDARCLRASATLEAVQPWWAQRPPV